MQGAPVHPVLAIALLLLLPTPGCGATPAADSSIPPASSDRFAPDAGAASITAEDAGDEGPPLIDAALADDDSAAAQQRRPCPADMVHVTHDYCPEVRRRCLERELNRPNNLEICHRFEPGSTTCQAPRVKLDYCIDRYEYPNREGAHPPWMVSWYDAEATCRHLGKRTCWDWEWVAACEGPDETPFPYGWARDNTKCNIDNQWINPRLSQAYSKKPDVALRELSRLDQSVPSGAMTGCISGFGVHDLPGNFDEWVTRAERNRQKSAWAGLKGGAWGHVRSACRPMTTSHTPEFQYYFISFRCCKEPQGAQPFVPPGSSPPPAVTPADRAPIPAPINAPGPSKRKVPRENRG